MRSLFLQFNSKLCGTAIIPICNSCHQDIHGEGGCTHSKEVLYNYKRNPNITPILKHKKNLERGKYHFFVGNNLILYGSNARLFNIDGDDLLSVDTSDNLFRLDILLEYTGGSKKYLMKNNELLIDTEDIYDMRYSGPSLTIERMSEGEKEIVVHLLIQPNAIIICEMNTFFNTKPFRVIKMKKPHWKQKKKIRDKVIELEQQYQELADEIDKQQKSGQVFGGVDVNELKAEITKQDILDSMRAYLEHKFCENFPSWESFYYHKVLMEILSQSPVFGQQTVSNKIQEKINEITSHWDKKAQKEFQNMEYVFVKYGGLVLNRNLVGLPPNPASTQTGLRPSEPRRENQK
jgi:hypothetical protein